MNKEEKIEISVNQEDVQNIIDCYEKDIKYITKLENNWNELKKYVQEELRDAEDDFAQEDFIKILDKMQKIEGGVNNE